MIIIDMTAERKFEVSSVYLYNKFDGSARRIQNHYYYVQLWCVYLNEEQKKKNL